jgi:uncharacterized protein (TIGR03083 family)
MVGWGEQPRRLDAAIPSEGDLDVATPPSHPAAPLRASHERLVALVSGLDEATITSASYDTEWSIGQVLSHLGSQAEIFDTILAAARDGGDPPGSEVFQPIWDRWNAKSPVQWRDDFLAVDEQHVAAIEALPDDFSIALFGMQFDLPGFVGFRLGEHAVHAWDVAVALDPTATVSQDAVELLVDRVGMLAGRSGRPSAQPFRVRVGTSDPARDLVVSVGESVTVHPAEPDDSYDGSVDLPAEAFLRLVYGRLDPDHSPAHTESGSRGLADLRATFGGF